MTPFLTLHNAAPWLPESLDLHVTGTTSAEGVMFNAEGGKITIADGEHLLEIDAPSNYTIGSPHNVASLIHRMDVRNEQPSPSPPPPTHREIQIAIDLPCIHRGTDPQPKPDWCSCGSRRLFACGQFDKLAMVDGSDGQIETARDHDVMVCSQCSERQETPAQQAGAASTA